MKTKVISLRLSGAELARYEKLAEQHNLSLPKVIMRYANLGYADELATLDRPNEELQKEFFVTMQSLFRTAK